MSLPPLWKIRRELWRVWLAAKVKTIRLLGLNTTMRYADLEIPLNREGISAEIVMGIAMNVYEKPEIDGLWRALRVLAERGVGDHHVAGPELVDDFAYGGSERDHAPAGRRGSLYVPGVVAHEGQDQDHPYDEPQHSVEVFRVSLHGYQRPCARSISSEVTTSTNGLPESGLVSTTTGVLYTSSITS